MKEQVQRSEISPRLLLITDRFENEIMCFAESSMTDDFFKNLVELYVQAIIQINSFVIGHTEWKELINSATGGGNGKPN